MNEGRIIAAACEIAAGMYTVMYASGDVSEEKMDAIGKLAWACAMTLAKVKP